MTLTDPFPASQIHWRIGATTQAKDKGIALAYIDARDVMDRLDAVVGPENWKNEFKEVMGRMVCRLHVRFGNEWVYREDGAEDTDVEAAKGGLSDAFKRAAVHFGIGRYLYRLPTQWVPIKPQGRSFAIVKPPDLPSWALPEGDKSKPRQDDIDFDPPAEGVKMTPEQLTKYEQMCDVFRKSGFYKELKEFTDVAEKRVLTVEQADRMLVAMQKKYDEMCLEDGEQRR